MSRIAAAVLAVLLGAAAALLPVPVLKKHLTVQNAETGEVYAAQEVQAGDVLEFGWTHSFEHIPWYEYYTVRKDDQFNLDAIAVAG